MLLDERGGGRLDRVLCSRRKNIAFAFDFQTGEKRTSRESSYANPGLACFGSDPLSSTCFLLVAHSSKIPLRNPSKSPLISFNLLQTQKIATKLRTAQVRRGIYSGTHINIHLQLPTHTIDSAAKMSRFFRGGDESSSDSSSDEEELYSEQEEEEQEEQSEEEESEEEDDDDDSSSDSDAGKKQGGASRFLEGWSESEESDTEQTTKVKSAKDKRHDELEATVTLITNAEKINDWNTISNGKHLPFFIPPAPWMLTRRRIRQA